MLFRSVFFFSFVFLRGQSVLVQVGVVSECGHTGSQSVGFVKGLWFGLGKRSTQNVKSDVKRSKRPTHAHDVALKASRSVLKQASTVFFSPH